MVIVIIVLAAWTVLGGLFGYGIALLNNFFGGTLEPFSAALFGALVFGFAGLVMAIGFSDN